MLQLAEEYRKASDLLRKQGRKGKPLSRAPWRLVAIHAIELFLNAFLLEAKHTPPCIRGMQHNLSKRTTLAVKDGLRLRKKTKYHLLQLDERREYLAARYETTDAKALSQLNRLTQSLEEVAKKVSAKIKTAP